MFVLKTKEDEEIEKEMAIAGSKVVCPYYVKHGKVKEDVNTLSQEHIVELITLNLHAAEKALIAHRMNESEDYRDEARAYVNIERLIDALKAVDPKFRLDRPNSKKLEAVLDNLGLSHLPYRGIIKEAPKKKEPQPSGR